MSLAEFQVLEKLGEGAYSTVYKVRRISDQFIYALKKVKLDRLKEKEKENALNEVRILASIQHPHIIEYKQAFIDEPTSCLCLITEYADNGDLFQKIQNHQKGNTYCHEGEIWKIFIQVVFGLKKLHDFKIFHRDLKSANVFLFSNGTVKLGDMNVSKVAKQGMLFTQTGTPYYASPEVWKDQPYDSKSDIWSLGCVLYEMLALKPPFRGNDMENLYNNVMTGKYQTVPNIYSNDIANVIKSMLQVNSRMRPTCLALLNMESIKKRIEKYFEANYLINERQTYQGIKRLSQNLKDNDIQDMLLRTIKYTDNLFDLKDKLPEPTYNGRKIIKRDLQKEQQEQKEETQKHIQNLENQTAKKIDALIPLSYITPMEKKVQNASMMDMKQIDVFKLNGNDESKSQKKPRKKRQSNNQLSMEKERRSPYESISSSKKMNLVLSTEEDYSDSKIHRQRDSSVKIQKNKYQSALQSAASQKCIINETSQELILPKLKNIPKETSISQDFSTKSAKYGKNGLIVNVNNVLKNEHVPLSYLKSKQILMKHVMNKSPKNIRNGYNKSIEASKSEGLLPELRGLSLESYKYLQNNQTIQDQDYIYSKNFIQQNMNHLRNQIKLQSSENQKSLKNFLTEKKEKLRTLVANEAHNIYSDLDSDSPYYVMPPQTIKQGFETTRTGVSTSTNLQMLQTYASNQSSQDTAKESDQANVSTFKTELKDKILMTRERFNQLKLRKRQQQSNDTSGTSTTIATSRTENNHIMGNNCQTTRLVLKNQKKLSFLQRDDSQSSDHIDRDEETIPLNNTTPNLNLKTLTLKKTVKSAIRQSFSRPLQGIPSYKLDGAKLIVNRIQVQLKRRFKLFCEVLNNGEIQNENNQRSNTKQFKEKWKFVRNVMDNMEKQKKMPLQDKTNIQNNQQPQTSSNFNQIQQMFENFKSMRASSSSGQQQQHNNQENQNPFPFAAHNISKISSKSKEPLIRKKALPPCSRKPLNQTHTIDLRKSIEQSAFLDQDSFTSTFNNNDLFILKSTDQSSLPQQMLTTRSNLVVDDELPEGLQQLPLESPMNTEKFMQRCQYLKQDQQQQQQALQIKNSLSKLEQIQNKILIRQSFAGLQQRCKAHQRLNKLLKRKLQEDKIITRMEMKTAFVKMIRNCIFKSKFENFLERSYQRLIEKAFDKIKENSWIIEERKEMLESIILKRQLKVALMKMQQRNFTSNAIEVMIKVFQKYQEKIEISTQFNLWRNQAHIEKQENNKISKLHLVLENQIYKRKGFEQYRRQIQQAKIKEQGLMRITASLSKHQTRNAFEEWKNKCFKCLNFETKQQILENLFMMNQNMQKQEFFTKWRSQIQVTKIAKQCEKQQSMFLIIKPLLRQKERRLKQQAFSLFKHRTDILSKVHIHLKLMLRSLKHQSIITLLQAFNNWKHYQPENVPKIMKLSYLDESSSQSDDDKQEEIHNFLESKSYEGGLKSPEDWIQENFNDNEEKQEDDFEQLNQIKRLSYETSILSKIAEKAEDVELREEISPALQFTQRRVSEGFGGNAKVNQNLRYL